MSGIAAGRRDPFPMTSPEAQQLADSVIGGGGGGGGDGEHEKGDNGSWEMMNTQSEGVEGGGGGPAAGHDDDAPDGASSSAGGGAASEGLLIGGGGRSKAATPDDIYADTDQDIVDVAHKEDEFLDRPMWESRGSIHDRRVVRGMRAMRDLYQRLYGDKLPPEEMLRTLCLATTLFFTIGGYWLLRSLKDAVTTALNGIEIIPRAKIVSVFVVLGFVTVYNRLLDSDIPRHRLFYIFGTFYFVVFVVIALLLMHPTIGLPNQRAHPGRILGWVSYCTIESFGSVMVTLFWSFANSNVSLETAKASYGVMVATAQVGSILGPTVVKLYGGDPAKCYLVGATCMLFLQGTMYMYVTIYGTKERNSSSTGQQRQQEEAPKTKKKERAGILEGLILFWKYNYIKGIFAISCLFMVEVTIVDFTMKLLARDQFAEEFPCETWMSCYNEETGEHGMSEEATGAFATFNGFFGQATNVLSFVLSLLGTSAVIRHLGFRLSLLLFPALCLAVIVFVRLYPTLYVLFFAMIALKACSYALNNPTKEMLYQPTNSSVKYKAKSWIDIFGDRGAKAAGSLVTNAFSYSAQALVANGSLVGIVVASFLIWNARFMGKLFDEYTASGYIVGNEGGGSDDDEDDDNIQMAIDQNKAEDTSCGIYDDNELGPEEEGQEMTSATRDTDDNDKMAVAQPEVRMV